MELHHHPLAAARQCCFRGRSRLYETPRRRPYDNPVVRTSFQGGLIYLNSGRVLADYRQIECAIPDRWRHANRSIVALEQTNNTAPNNNNDH